MLRVLEIWLDPSIHSISMHFIVWRITLSSVKLILMIVHNFWFGVLCYVSPSFDFIPVLFIFHTLINFCMTPSSVKFILCTMIFDCVFYVTWLGDLTTPVFIHFPYTYNFPHDTKFCQSFSCECSRWARSLRWWSRRARRYISRPWPWLRTWLPTGRGKSFSNSTASWDQWWCEIRRQWRQVLFFNRVCLYLPTNLFLKVDALEFFLKCSFWILGKSNIYSFPS